MIITRVFSKENCTRRINRIEFSGSTVIRIVDAVVAIIGVAVVPIRVLNI